MARRRFQYGLAWLDGAGRQTQDHATRAMAIAPDHQKLTTGCHRDDENAVLQPDSVELLERGAVRKLDAVAVDAQLRRGREDQHTVDHLPRGVFRVLGVDEIAV